MKIANIAKYQTSIKEDVYHGIVECPRVNLFWEKLLPFFRKYGIDVKDINKIFGLQCSKNKVLLNLVIQTAQKAIWFSRYKLETKDILEDIFELFKKYLARQMYTVKKIVSQHVFENIFKNNGIIKISRYK